MKEFHKKVGPFLKSNNSTRKIRRNLLIALLPIILFAIYKNGIIPYINEKTNLFGLFYPLILIIVPMIIVSIIELLYCILILKKKNKDITLYLKDSFCIFYGLLLGLILPINTPIYIVILGTLVATITCKILYMAFSNNTFNPALVGRLFIIVVYASVISSSGGYLNNYELDTIGTSIPAINGIGTYETLVEPYGSLFNFFIGTIPGMVGTTSVLLCLIAFIYLTITRSIKWKIPVVYIFTVFAITLMIGNINGLGIWYPLLQILSGGLMFGAVFIAPDSSTSPVTPIGQVLYALFLGILTVIFRYLTPFQEGLFVSILIMNLFVNILDKIGSQARFNFKKSLIPFVLAWIFILSSGLYIGNKYDVVALVDPDYTVISKEETNNKVIYTASQKGEISDIKATITIVQGEVVEFNILKQDELLYSKIDENNYIEKILKKQQKLDSLADLEGAEELSNILKKLVSNTLIDYKNNGGIEYEGDPDFNIVYSEEQDGKVIYEITQKAVKANIKLRIVFKHDVIDSITVVEQNESDFDTIIEKNYITTLIENQQVLKDLDTISEANETSNSLKQAVINTKKDYWRNYEE